MNETATYLLAVDDTPANLFVLKELVEEHLPGCTLLTANHAKEGLAVIAEKQVDGILIDVQMPEIDGVEMCRQLKTDEASKHLPVILITAHGSTSELRARGLKAGADDFISRPIDNIELVAKIQVMLRIKRMEDELRTTNARLEELVADRTRGWQQSERELGKTHAIVQAVLKGTTDAVYVKDTQGRYLLANESAARAMGRSKDDVVGKSDAELFPQEVASRLMATDREIMDAGESIAFEETTSAADTTTTWLTSKGPYRDDDGELLGVVARPEATASCRRSYRRGIHAPRPRIADHDRDHSADGDAHRGLSARQGSRRYDRGDKDRDPRSGGRCLRISV